MDPELAMALRVSMEEERARQEAAAKVTADEEAAAGGEGAAAAAVPAAAEESKEAEGAESVESDAMQVRTYTKSIACCAFGVDCFVVLT